MPAIKGLTDAKAKAAKATGKPYKLSDRDAMYLLVGANGSKNWMFAYRMEGVAQKGPNKGKSGLLNYAFNLGKCPDVDLDEARKRRAAAAELVSKGIHPKDAKQAENAKAKKELATTFGGIAQEWIDANAPDPADPNPKGSGKWSHYYVQQIRNAMGRYVINAPLGTTPIKEVTSADIFNLVQGIADRKGKAAGDERKTKGAPSIAVLLKQWSSAVFALAIATQRAVINPAEGFKVSTAVKKPKPRSNKALDEDELRSLLSALPRYSEKKPGNRNTGSRETVIAIELLMLTAARTVELRKAQWPEFDFMTATWKIPAERMKMGEPHVVPLSTQAIVLLQELREINPPPKTGPQWLFPNRRRGSVDCMSATTINRALGNMGFNGEQLFRAHGARGTASTYLHGADYEPLIVESALAHKQKGVAGVYNQGKYLKQRRAMMQAYADYLDSLRPREGAVAA
ncbi:integrase [Paraburkholderia sp. BL27I4N3]|uniref:tyrosine-type recombinase/integrase n=1 Tax=Paraburkholderia sp. BL27I4N3 TaxID=1938805 RepID=UPI000E254171|nr:site-specific integrase [Paraburkholderia sp. BL27I4N3]REE21221.1 integrase [Paraburkholderia sp. BL27I4N3]